MALSEVVLVGTTLFAGTAAVGAIIRERKRPVLDAAQAANALVNSDQVQMEIERTSRALDASRDLRVLDLEGWGDKMRPWIRAILERDDMLCGLIRQAYIRLGLPAPELPEFPDIPEFPPPRPM